MTVSFTAGTKTWHDEFQANLLTTTSPEDLEVNMSNSNAHRVCQALGIELDPDWCGNSDAEVFLGRVLLALALSPADEGIPAHEIPFGVPGRPAWTGQARFIECGHAPGYLQDRLAQLRELADWAVANQAVVMWG